MNWKGIAITMGLLAAAAGQAKVETLGQPCRAFNILGGITVKDPKTGTEYLALTNMNEETHCELLLIDFKRNKGEVYRAPAGAGSWALNEAPGGRLPGAPRCRVPRTSPVPP